MRALGIRIAGIVVVVAGVLAFVPAAMAAGGVPRPDHVVVVMEENTSASSIYGNTSQAPYINSLGQGGAEMTQSFAITHPSQPNYLALFSGSTQGVTDDSCPQSFSGANLASELIAAGLTFSGYSESMPSDGYTGCSSGEYARKHDPWTDFTNVPATDNLTFASWPSSNFSSLPTVSFVIPNLCDDMHDCSIQTGDTWLQTNIDSYAQWAKTHNSLLIVTWDEDDSTTTANQIATIFYGAGVKPGQYSETINHYNVLRTIEDAYGLPYAGASSTATPVTDIWADPNTVTVTNPGNQTSTAGTAISPLQVQGTDSASGQALTYSATGLPAGLSMSSGGQITGTPTTAGTSTVTVTGTDGTGATGSTTFTWTVRSAAALLSGQVYELGRAGTSQVIDDPEASTASAKQLIVYSNHNGSNQEWVATANADGSYTFKNLLSGMCLEDSGGSTAPGNPIVQNPCTGQARQNWTAAADGSGFALVNQVSGLSITPGGAANGSTLTQQGGANTAWTFTHLAGPSLVSGGVYELGRAGTSQVIDDPEASTASGTQLLVWTNHNGSNQEWISTANGDGSYTFRNVFSGLCLEDSGGSTASGNPIVENPCIGQGRQNWTAVPSGSGFALVNQVSGLSITPAGTADGSKLTQAPGGGTAWTFTQLAGPSLVSGGVYELGRAGTSQVIDDPEASTASATQLIVWTNHNGSNQEWVATANGDGSYTFKNVLSGLCLEDSGASTASGNPIVQNPCTGQARQNWTAVPSGPGFALVNQLSGLSITPAGTADGSKLTQQPGDATAWTFTQVG